MPSTPETILYEEHLSSNRTTALFAALSGIFIMLFFWVKNTSGILPVVFAVFAAIFFFYTLNYRSLRIRLTPEMLKLSFGIFTWTIPVANIASCCLDKLPKSLEYGGAGIHFFLHNQRYRVSLNFLEYPRLVIALKKKQGSVCDVSFSTRQPDKLLRLIQTLALN